MKKEKKDNYTIRLIVLGESWTTHGDTVDEALSKFELDWQTIKGKGVLYVSQGKRKHEHLMTMFLLRKIFSNKIIRMHWAHNLEFLLKSDNTSNIPKV